MISELIIDDPAMTPIRHWESVPWLKGRTSINFKPGVNIVYGQNGSGKSTTINAIATLMHCRNSNWPRVDRKSLMLFMTSAGYILDGMRLVHDGSPCRYLGIDPAAAPPAGIGVNPLVLEAAKETESRPLEQMSHGQASLLKLSRFLKAEPRDVEWVVKPGKVAKAWKTLFDGATASLLSPVETKNKAATILLDEVDRSMDFTKQALVWKQVRLLAEAGHQIIIASHSPWAAVQPGAHYIETTEGYLAQTRAALNVLLDMNMRMDLPPTSKKRGS